MRIFPRSLRTSAGFVAVAVLGAFGTQSASTPTATPEWEVTAEATLPDAERLWSPAVDPTREVLYVADRTNDLVYVMDQASLEVTQTIPVPDEPISIAVGPTGVIYVAQYTGNYQPGHVAVIEPGAPGPLATVPVGDSPTSVSVSPDGTRLYVGHASSTYVSVFDITSPSEPAGLPPIDLPGSSQYVTVSPDGSTLFIPDRERRVFVVDVESGTVTATWNTPGHPLRVTLNSTSTRAVVTQTTGPTLVWDIASHTLVETLDWTESYSQSEDPALNSTFLVSSRGVGVLDRSTSQVVQVLPIAGGAWYSASDPISHATFIASFQSPTITRIDPAAPIVTSQPQDATIREGETAAFRAVATSTTDPLTTQWESSADNAAWTTISGATSTEYETPAAVAADSGTRFRAVFTDRLGRTATTSPATLTVTTQSAPPVITQHPQDVTTVPESEVTFTADASSATSVSAQWQHRADSDAEWANIRGATDPTHQPVVTLANSGTQYRAVFTNDAGSAVTNAATLRVTESEAVDPGRGDSEAPAAGNNELAATGFAPSVAALAVGLALTISGAIATIAFLRRRTVPILDR